MYRVVLYFDESCMSFTFSKYNNANLFLKFMLRRGNNILVGKIIKGEDTIKVVSNIGPYYE